jgi:SPP1 family predicted phage head-tail adaptor
MMGGKLNHRLRYEEATDAADALGQLVPTWATVIPLVWGEVRTLSGREAVRAQAWQVAVDHVVSIRWPFAQIKPSGRFVDLDVTTGNPGVYNVVRAVDEDGRNQSLTVYVAEQLQPTATGTSNL